MTIKPFKKSHMRFFVVITLLLTSITSQAQEYKTIDNVLHVFVYDYRFCEEHKNPNSLKSHEMILEIGENHSKFYSSSRAFTDSLLMRYANESPDIAFSKIFPLVSGSPIPSYCNFYVYKNLPEKGVTVFTASDMGTAKYRVDETNRFKWSIDNRADTSISGLQCKKATVDFAGRSYTAWFTMDIPISDGPYKFNGLPGLIVRICDSENEHSFTLVEKKNANKKPMIFVNNHYIISSGKEYVKAFESSKSDLINELERGTFSDETAKIRAITKVQRRNNFIERF